MPALCDVFTGLSVVMLDGDKVELHLPDKWQLVPSSTRHAYRHDLVYGPGLPRKSSKRPFETLGDAIDRGDVKVVLGSALPFGTGLAGTVGDLRSTLDGELQSQAKSYAVIS